ncbi:MAG: MFS transporter [Bacillota bacterium]|nr:MFS transporter [Bacillota bacterium]
MSTHDSSIILKNPSLIIFLITRVFMAFSYQMLTIAVRYQIVELNGKALDLGLLGLAEFLPMFMLTFIVGYVADRYNRKVIISLCLITEAVGILLLAVRSYYGWINKGNIFAIIFFISIAYSFQGPPMQALLPNIVSKEHFPQAAAWMASAFQFAVILGPALGGVFYVLGPSVVYLTVVMMCITTSILVLFIKMTQSQSKRDPVNLKTLLAGLTFIESKPIVMGAISLDLFAVLFGGATALLPLYAKNILKVGPMGLGLLQAAPAVGALLMSLYLAKKPLKSSVGKKMFTAVIFFGVSTMIFAVSTSFILSLLILCVMGAADVISVVIRSTLIQLETPDEMRGRVSSVNLLFVGTSNQLGEFESGLMASLLSVVPAVLIGGLGTVVVVILWTKLFPQLLHADKLKPSTDEA